MAENKSVYRSFFQWAFDTKRISINPASRLFLAKTTSFPTIPITTEEVAQPCLTPSEAQEANMQQDMTFCSRPTPSRASGDPKPWRCGEVITTGRRRSSIYEASKEVVGASNPCPSDWLKE